MDDNLRLDAHKKNYAKNDLRQGFGPDYWFARCKMEYKAENSESEYKVVNARWETLK